MLSNSALLIILRLDALTGYEYWLEIGTGDFVKEHFQFHLPTDNNFNISPESAINNKPIGTTRKIKFNIDPKFIHAIYENFIKNNLETKEPSTTDGCAAMVKYYRLSVIHFLIFYKWYLGICQKMILLILLTNGWTQLIKRSEYF